MQIILSDCLIWSVSAMIYWSSEGLWVSVYVCVRVCVHSYCRLTHFHELALSLCLSNTHTRLYVLSYTNTYTNAHTYRHPPMIDGQAIYPRAGVFKGIKLFTHIVLISNSLHSIKPELTVKTKLSQFLLGLPEIYLQILQGCASKQLPGLHVYLSNAWGRFKGFTINSASSVSSIILWSTSQLPFRQFYLSCPSLFSLVT